MLISAMTVTVALPLAHSLKDKRMTAKSLIARVQNRFKVSAAEVEAQDEWCTLVLGLAVVANERRPRRAGAGGGAAVHRGGAGRHGRGDRGAARAAVARRREKRKKAPRLMNGAPETTRGHGHCLIRRNGLRRGMRQSPPCVKGGGTAKPWRRDCNAAEPS